jgi:hypothetical protein
MLEAECQATLESILPLKFCSLTTLKIRRIDYRICDLRLVSRSTALPMSAF